MSSVAPEIRTYRDALDDLMAFAGTLSLDIDERRARIAIRDGLEEMAMARDWKYYRRIRQINLVAPFTGETGATIAYDHTGGAYCERQLTLTPGGAETLPDWTRDAELVLSDDTVLYPIAEKLNDTIAQLPEDRNPGADVAAGGFTLYKAGYPLDGDIAKVYELNDETGALKPGYIHPQEWLRQVRSLITTQDTGFQWTLLGDDDSIGQLEFRFYGLPGSAQTIQFLAQCLPRRLRYTGYADRERSGTSASIAAVSGAQTVTGTGTGFVAGMRGALLRFSEDGTEPDTLTNPPAEEKIITAVASTSSLTVHNAVSATYSGAGFTISDPLDVPRYLKALFRASCRRELAHLMDRHDRDKIEADFDLTLWRAQERDEGLVQTPAMPNGWVAFKIPTWMRIMARG